MNKNILLVAEPRTGSHLLVEWLTNAGYMNIGAYSNQELKKCKKTIKRTNNNICIHVHDLRLTDFKKTLKIFTYRQDVFKQLTSLYLAIELNQFLYKDYIVHDKPLKINIDYFNELANNLYHHKISVKKIKSKENIMIISYEEIIKNVNILKNFFEINYSQDYWIQKKNPNQSKKLIQNLDQCKVYFDQEWKERFFNIM